MRKWMRERMKRRKKPEETQGTGSTKPAPLQPDYYEAAAPEAPTSEPAEAEAPEAEAQASEVSQADDARSEEGGSQAAAGDAQRRRRRRGRGGRGRGRSGRTSAPPREVAAAEEAPALDAEPSAALPEPAAQPARQEPAAPAHAARPSKGTVTLAIGLPGSGKSSWFKRHEISPLSSDLLRALLFDDAQEQRFQDLVFSNLRSMLKARLIARRPTNYVDATNLTPHERHNWIKLAKDYGYEVHAVFFDVPLEVCLDRNRRRHRSVDEAVMQRMASKLRAPTFEEGFTKITVVRVKKKDGDAAAAS